MDSVPIIAISGQVPTPIIGTDGFQEADVTGITRPCTKYNYLVKDPNDIAYAMHEAIYIALNGRPGPVLVDIPKDVLFAQGRYLPLAEFKPKKHHTPHKKYQIGDLSAIVELIKNAKKPVIYGGGGLINSGKQSALLLRELVERANIPCTLTLMGLGALPADHQHFLGMLGMHGTYEANMVMHECDLMIGIGVRFDDRVTGRVSGFSPNSKKIHVDIDPSSINKIIKVDHGIVSDATTFLQALLKQLNATDGYADGDYANWWQQIAKWRSRNSLAFKNSDQTIKPQHAIKRLYEKTRHLSPFITTEVGQHQMWAAQYFGFHQPNKWMTSGGLGTMGYGLPAAIGVQKANLDGLVIDIAGEASILMNIQELATAVQYRLPVKVFIINNKWMGMVRQWQELLHGGRYSQSYSEALPDFVKLAEAFGAEGLRISTPDELDLGIDQIIASKAPMLIDVCVDPKENCFPMIPSGAAHNEMILNDYEGDVGSVIDDDGKKLV
jgi:acetolactate synthase-1/2/3 large subunit